MRSALALTLVVAVAAVSVTADKCLSICESKEIWGFDKNTQLCQCEDGIGPNRTGPNVCVCQMCYKKEGKNVVAYGYNAEGVCPWGTDCSACDLKVSSSSSSGSGSLSAGLDSNASNKTDAGSASQSGMGNIAPDKGFELSDLQTWQIALLICSLTLIVAVAMVAIVAWHWEVAAALGVYAAPRASSLAPPARLSIIVRRLIQCAPWARSLSSLDTMRSLFLLLLVVFFFARSAVLVDAAKCEDICNTASIWGFDRDFKRCECDAGVGPNRSGPNACSCGVCYSKTDGVVIAYAYSDGACKFGTDCGNCELDASSSSSSGSKKDPTTPSSGAPSSSSGSRGVGSLGNPSKAAESSGSSTSDANVSSSDDSSLKTWQIALIICSGVLVFGVAVIAIMSCYCKTRDRMKDNRDLEDAATEYQDYWQMTSAAAGENLFNNSGGPTTPGRASYSSNHSRPNSGRNVQQHELTYGEDRIPPSSSYLGRSSTGSDMSVMYNSYQQREREFRPSHEVGSRKHITVEL
ncbi:hypothetical protein Poli38472_013125 [Pythium oligandrum]|uniref:Integral membrane protein n=1 Tax=Pythium oligandrum TaxID=41045 RepID=A0A8K1C2I9_PYTOL|nr:hypothetical protein Poli38472_013125 [Pythium oligandrum]|eukprot:TMW55234.1 hypothetical protein Poli38472_013125 [Pythium oligandrum]